MPHVAKIARWGNSAALRLNADVLKEAHLKVGTPVEVVVTPEGVLLKSSAPLKRRSLQDMIAACNPNAPMPASLTAWEKAPPEGQELL